MPRRSSSGARRSPDRRGACCGCARARVRVVPLAPHPAFQAAGSATVGRGPGATGPRRRRRRDGAARAAGALPRVLRPVRRAPRRRHVPARPRQPGRAAAAARRSRPNAWPPRVLIVGASPGDRAALARAAARLGAGDALVYAPGDAAGAARRAGPRRPRRGHAGAHRRGRPAGARRDRGRRPGRRRHRSGRCRRPSGGPGSSSSHATRSDWPRRSAPPGRTTASAARLVEAALERPSARRTWADVALETRRIYAEVGVRSPEPTG